MECTSRIEPRGKSLQLVAPTAEPAARIEEPKQSSEFIGGEEHQVKCGHLLAEKGNIHQGHDSNVEHRLRPVRSTSGSGETRAGRPARTP